MRSSAIARAFAVRSRLRLVPFLVVATLAASSLVASASMREDQAYTLVLSPSSGPAGATVALYAPAPSRGQPTVRWDAATVEYRAQTGDQSGPSKATPAARRQLRLTLAIPATAVPGEHIVQLEYSDGTAASAKFVVTSSRKVHVAAAASAANTPTPTAALRIPQNESIVSINTPTRTPLVLPPTATQTSPPAPPPPTPTLPPVLDARDKFKQPFASTSIWNMPIGSNANYVWAGIRDWSAWGVFLEENIIINRPTAPVTPVYYNGDAWSGGSRCSAQGGVVFSAPLPSGYIIPGASGSDTPNYAAAIMTSDGNSYIQGQPLTHCTSGGPWTILGQDATVSLYGDGILGAQGGSHLSSAGGAVRLGEWRSRAIKHALKTVLNPANYSQSTGGFRWPAVSADAGYRGDYNGSNPAVKMGSLLALRPDFNVGQLQTEPGRIVARAMMDYGAYIADSGWDPAYISVEQGPDGNAADEFQQEFGFSMSDSSPNSAWSRDWRTIMTNTYVIDNNGPATIGGGGVPRVPLAPPIGN